MRIPILYIMCGLPASGKTTEAKKIVAEDGAEYVSSDEIRKELYGDESCQSDNQKVFEHYYKRMNQYLSEGKDVVIDSTNVTLKSRKRILSECKVDCIKLVYIINTPIEICYENDLKRERHVGKEVIDKFWKNFQCPQSFEGFDSIVIIQNNHEKKFDKDFFEETIKKMNDFDQKNPHHKFTLGEHCLITKKLLEKMIDNTDSFYEKRLFFTEKVKKSVCYAALIHDVGKMFSQSFDKDGVAHYYNHANIGTYYLVSHMSEFLDSIDKDCFQYVSYVLFLVNYHMLAHEIHTEKAINKYKNLFGEDLFNLLMKFQKCDSLASGTVGEIDL